MPRIDIMPGSESMNPAALYYLLVSNILGGSAYIATQYALRETSVRQIVFWRTCAGMILFLPFLRSVGRSRISGEDWLRMAAVGIFGYAAPLAVGTLGQKYSSATNASLLVGVEPISILILSAIFLAEPLTWLKAVAIVSGLTGAAMIILQGHALGAALLAPDFKGNMILFLHGFLWSLYSVVGKPTLRRVDPMTFSAVTTAFALLPLTVMATPPMLRGGLALPSTGTLLCLVYLAAGTTFYAVYAWNKALELVPASQLANFIFVQPLVGTALGAGFLRERFTAWSALGGALIILGVYGAMREPAAPV